MAMEVHIYRVKIRFERLFPEPEIFDDPSALARSYLSSAGLSPEKLARVSSITRETLPFDDVGKPSAVAGYGKYRYKGKTVQSEFMKGANIDLEYVDFGTGLSPEDHAGMWKRGRWGDMRFETKEFQHQNRNIELPDIAELYRMLRARADPTTIASVELPEVGDKLFQATVDYLEMYLKSLARKDLGTVEVYTSRNLTVTERRALERRLTREGSDSTVYVILSRPSSQRP